MKEMLRTNIAMNDSCDTRLCYTHTAQCHTDHTLQCWSEVFFFFLPKCLFVTIVMYPICIFQ